MWVQRSSIVALAGLALSQCSPSSASEAGSCYPDSDGVTDMPGQVDIVVDDTGFYAGSPDSSSFADAGMKVVISTQNSSTITFTLTNKGTRSHGFEVECTSVLATYPDLPAGCSPTACFPSDSTVPPLEPGKSKTITFVTPVPDGLLYPFKSSAPGDADNRALNGADGTAWSLM